MDREKYFDVILILCIFVLGMVLTNEFIDYRYKMTLLNAPCNLCQEVIDEEFSNSKGLSVYYEKDWGFSSPNTENRSEVIDVGTQVMP